MLSNHSQFNAETHSSLEMPDRPSSFDSSGSKEHLYTNHFTCSLDHNISLYQYEISLEEIDPLSNNWIECDNRSRCTTLMQSIIRYDQLEPYVYVWYDEQKYLYSTSSLSTPQFKFDQNHQYRLHIKSLCTQSSTNDIDDYINGSTKLFPYDAVRMIEILLKRSLQNRIKIIKNKFYFLDQPPIELKNGFEQRTGFIQALNLSAQKLTLNVQTKSTTFYPQISLLDFVNQQIGLDQMTSNTDYTKLDQMFKHCLIVANQSHYEFHQFDSRRANEIQLRSGEFLFDYYQNTLNITLIHPDYPCIQVYRRYNYNQPFYLPLEVCKIKEWQIYDEIIQEQQGERYIPTPEDRYCYIREALHACDYNFNHLCHTIGFRINTDEMLEFDARVLPLPTIKAGLNYYACIDEGTILPGGHICTPKFISKLAITYFGTNFAQNKSQFEQLTNKLIDVMERYNLYGNHEEHIVSSSFDDINGYFQLMRERDCQFVVCIMNEENATDLTQLRMNIKKSGTILHGIMTQCARYSDIPSDEKSLANYCENLMRKINFKNGGINTTVDLDMVLNTEEFSDDLYMFLGADVICSHNVTRQYPSIAAIVGSGNSSCSTTAVRVCKQYPKQGTSSIDIIVGATEMIEQLLDYNQQINQRLPNKIVFYRHGIDERHFIEILKSEIPAIRQAFNNVYGDKTKHPLLSYIAVNKRHHTRFFTYNPNQNREDARFTKTTDETDNMSIGCVIDTTIVHPYQHNFYLNSHNSFHGVNQPPLYHVLLDEIGFTSNTLELLTYYLCYTDPRSSASEAVPSVAHQAGIAAWNARDLFTNHDDDDNDLSTMNGTGRSRPLRNSSSDDFDYEILQVHESLTNKPVFS